jgi:hypothetical protein
MAAPRIKFRFSQYPAHRREFRRLSGSNNQGELDQAR